MANTALFLSNIEKDVIEIKILQVSSQHFSEGSHVHAYKKEGRPRNIKQMVGRKYVMIQSECGRQLNQDRRSGELFPIH